MPRSKPTGYISQMEDQRSWSAGSACQDEDPSLFDTVRVNKHTRVDLDVEVARDICADCPVMMQCLRHAIVYDMTDDVWGGMIPEERDEWALANVPRAELPPRLQLSLLLSAPVRSAA